MSLFPPDFLWGTSQSGHQIEGENYASDWWRWEQRSGRIANGDTSKVGAEFLNRYVKDLALARSGQGDAAVQDLLALMREHPNASWRPVAGQLLMAIVMGGNRKEPPKPKG